ncbi:hypothetical protein PPTG_19547 [Phytophthora nicotianae INRA-310]|uniref:FHA domain-containing protein n=1 Tax=Phytophthora nicotianae (strain INRA-310) TaxID=761204 RepID=W2PCP9_PHYN3|nr:hypothetical protein PPTG_19547 [Phytophthora nicotianae INRA-310]ETM98430.1 hypothetical protein PPTG_19547 [Phytophthora nicotianae INRA-310]
MFSDSSMTASSLRCFRLEATRGPHSGLVLRHCHADYISSSPLSHELSIGRKKRCWLRLPQDLEVSSVHAEFRFIESDTSVTLRDVKSTNGTKLNGKPLHPQQDYLLTDEDVISIGRTSLRVVQVVHGRPCGEEMETSAAGGSSILTPSISSSVAQPTAVPKMIVLGDSTEDKGVASNTTGSNGTTEDQPDTEPAHDELLLKPVISGGKSKKRQGSVKLQKSESNGDARVGAVGEYTPEEATCTVCRVVIGQLDLLEQQSHLNVCLGGRVVAPSTASSSTAAMDAEPKSLKRGNAGSASARTKKPRKTKAGEEGHDPAAPKTKKPRIRKRANAGESIELALALAGKKMSKEEQTDVQLVATKKKLEQLDEQIAKLTKRRMNLVKTLDRLERTKEKLRRSQVLPPAKVLQLLDLKAALTAIFPANRRANPDARTVSTERSENTSAVAKHYAPLRWSESGITIECDEEKRAELTAVAAISMWARASQQLFGLQRDTLLYRNSILRAFLGDDDTDSSIMKLDNDDADDEDGAADFEQKSESEEKSEAKLSLPQADSEVPDVVKRVFLNWQRDLEFLNEQTAEELESALEAINEAQARAQGDEDQREGPYKEDGDEHTAVNPEVTTSKSTDSAREERRLACEYMAQVMIQLIAEKRQHASESDLAEGVQHNEQQKRQQYVIDLVDSSGEEFGQQEQASDIVVASDNQGSINELLIRDLSAFTTTTTNFTRPVHNQCEIVARVESN